jgi:hypothetical protein
MEMILLKIFTIISCLLLTLVLFNKENIMADGLRGLWESIKSRLPDMQSLYQRRSNEKEVPAKITQEVPGLSQLVLDAARKRGGINLEGENALSNLNVLKNLFGQLESGGDLEASHPGKGRAQGKYQWKTRNPEGQASFRTALNRASNYYTNNNLSIPSWIQEAKKHNNPTRLNEEQQDSLFLADIFERKYSDKKINKFLQTGNRDVLKDLWLNQWHTRPTDKIRKYADSILYPEAQMWEPMTMAALQDDTMALSNKGGMVYKNYHKYKPRAI